MEIHVKENAINSLIVGIDFYNKFLYNLDNLDISVSHYGNLKFAVIAIHNSLELLTKAILLDINELLVFEAKIEEDIYLCNLLKEQYYSKRRNALFAYHSVFSDKPYKTIDYSKAIKLLMKIFNDKLNYYDEYTLIRISEYRNTLSHLGYASVFEWYKILVEIDKALEIILTFYIGNLIHSEDYFTSRITKMIESTLEKSKEHIHEIWMASYEYTINDINELIEIFFDNSIIKIESMEENNEYGLLECINFKYDERKFVWRFVYSYLNEAILILDNSNIIVACISVEDKNLKYSYDENGLPDKVESVYSFMPKDKILYKEQILYGLGVKDKYERFLLVPQHLITILNKYLKKFS